MLKNSKRVIILLLFPLILSMGIAPALPTIHADHTQEIPQWIQDTAVWWGEGTISDDEYLSAMEFLINEGILVVPANLLSSVDEQIKSYPPSKPITEHYSSLNLTMLIIIRFNNLRSLTGLAITASISSKAALN